MEKLEAESLKNFTVDLTQKAQDIKKQINNQTLILESIQYQSNQNEEIFQRNNNIFSKALVDLDNDGRNYVILALIVVILVLIYILKN